MKFSDIKCRKCGQNAMQVSKRGAYLERVNPKGETLISECFPSCHDYHGDQDDALINAINGT